MKIIEGDSESGTVTFDPFQYEYNGSDETIEKILKAAEQYTVMDTGGLSQETGMPTEKYIDPPVQERRWMLKNRFETYGVEFSESQSENSLRTGSIVETPEGKGVVDEIITELGEDEEIQGTDLDPSDDSVYVVALVSGGFAFFKSDDVSSSEFDVDVDGDSTEQIQSANAQSRLRSILPFASNDWTMPDSWKESDTPARLILLDAWASMGGQFDCDGSCCMGELDSERLCAAMKDAALGTTEWRGGWTE